MTITPELEAAIRAEYFKFYHAIKVTDPTLDGSQANFQRLLDKVRQPTTKGGLGLGIDILGQPGGENIFTVAFQKAKAEGTLTFNASADPNANTYKPINPWKTDNSKPAGGIHNKQNDFAESQATGGAVNDLVDGMRALNKYLNTPDTPIEKVVRKFPLDISEQDLKAANPTLEEARLLYRRQLAARAKGQE